MSNIPSSAISNAFVPVQRAANESIQARKIQSQKVFHHTEEVEELDDTAVNSVNDESAGGGAGGGQEGEAHQRRSEELVDIPAIEALEIPPPRASDDPGVSHLDISA